jgi:3'-phosphoadenosine 5'-phosphosulfate sulfotransferase (PAPS reductase)/FAD synthetase
MAQICSKLYSVISMEIHSRTATYFQGLSSSGIIFFQFKDFPGFSRPVDTLLLGIYILKFPLIGCFINFQKLKNQTAFSNRVQWVSTLRTKTEKFKKKFDVSSECPFDGKLVAEVGKITKNTKNIKATT